MRSPLSKPLTAPPAPEAPPTWGLDLEDSMQSRLNRAVNAIRTVARGRVCGTCKHLREDRCSKQLNVHGDALAVLYPSAIACVKHEVK